MNSPALAPLRRPAVRAAAAAVAGVALLTSMTGCRAVLAPDTWAVTYKVELSGKDTSALKQASYEENDGRGGESKIVQAESLTAKTDAAKPGVATWSQYANVTAEKKAGITATPAPGVTATCRILLDEKREIAVETGKPGEPVTCSVQTPAFEKKK